MPLPDPVAPEQLADEEAQRGFRENPATIAKLPFNGLAEANAIRLTHYSNGLVTGQFQLIHLFDNFYAKKFIGHMEVVR